MRVGWYATHDVGMVARRRGSETGDTGSDLPAAGPPLSEDHRWLEPGDPDLDVTAPRTTKVGTVRLAKVRRVAGPRKQAS